MTRFFWIAFALVLMAGCIRLEREMPRIDYFTLEAERGAALGEARFGPVRMQRMRVSPRFEGDRFIYRPETLRFEEDYYNRFFAPPGDLIAEELRRWLEEAGLFEAVLAGPERLDPSFYVEGRVAELYGDFRESPRAILALELAFIHDEAARSRTLVRRGYRRAIPLEAGTPSALAEGWSRALEEIFREFESDLRQVSPPVDRRSMTAP